ncbi:uncharacterized protein LOC105687664 [Athalia rosae]|uniref:uncharacterized protein LOC105687664 n=1 Tax=Athalia rosae TaxID=37344 RepID=UPI0020347AC7|nr:uncharacterized protein LOC105687664 [Athalia rosae]
MYEKQNLEESFEETNSDDDFAFCNIETGQKFDIKCSPPEDVKLVAKNRFTGTRPLSRSLPRKKRSLYQYRINRSLNFEIGSSRHDNVFKSPNCDSEESPLCNEKYLTRSAKILRSLNINFSPSNIRAKRINKTLNFDSSPSPKKMFSSSESLCDKRSPKFESNINRIVKINKTLNFSSSSNGSHSSSCLGSSINSIDENQNQTPSHKNRNVKKSLNYLTPSPTLNTNTSRSMNRTPMSREKFINDLKAHAETADLQSNKQSGRKSKNIDAVSTPRNLLQDFVNDEKNERPFTPENMFQFVPESMSAIKKSHKKERQSHRSQKSHIIESREHYHQTDDLTQDPIILSHSEERPVTPITNDTYPSPTYSLGSIKQSHKKDKSKKRAILNNSEDEISDSGSIFDYTELKEREQVCETDISHNSQLDSSVHSNDSSGFGIISFKQEDKGSKTNLFNNSIEELTSCGTNLDYSHELKFERDTNSEHSISIMSCNDDHSKSDDLDDSKERLKLSPNQLELISPKKYETSHSCSNRELDGNQNRPVTPENVINVLDQIMTDSIKKSHKKNKDMNKKIFIKPLIILEKAPSVSPLSSSGSYEENQDSSRPSDHYNPEHVSRAGTPENVNSSRLLLGQFSSVKKSHKKNKHQKIVTEFEKRQKYFNREDQEGSTDNLSTPNNGFASKRRKSSTIPVVSDTELISATPDKLIPCDRSTESSASDASPLEKSTPNKRKKSFSMNETGTSASSVDLSPMESSSMEYESAEEEFKIFTPIKKRRSLHTVTDIKRISPLKCESEDPQPPLSESLACTPILPENFFTTPPSTSRENMSEKKNDSDSIVCEEYAVAESANGRSTPQNRSTAELIFNINSIKKSHKKDKKNSRLRRSLNVADENSDLCNDTNTDLTTENYDHDPEPSTSGENLSTEKETNYSPIRINKTPPNCPKVISYLKLRQADSIKRSHKKVREQKRRNSTRNDPELSDDGSIFDTTDKISLNNFNESISNSDVENVVSSSSGIASPRTDGNNAASQSLVQTPPNRSKPPMQIESIKKSHKKVREFKRVDARDLRLGAEFSDDGSIFDPHKSSDESMKDPAELRDTKAISQCN